MYGMMLGEGFEKGRTLNPQTDSLRLDEGRMDSSAEQMARELIAENPDLNGETSAWTVTGDATEIRQRLLSWAAGEGSEQEKDPIGKRVAYAKEYLRLLERGLA